MHWIPSARELADAFAQHEPELLVSVGPSGAELAALAAVRDQLAAEVPLIVLRDQIDGTVIGADMAHGARDTTTLASPAHVQAVIRRELRALRMERTLTNTLRAAQEYRRQLETVLHRSNDAIAQVQEGIVVQANASWLELFGHADAGTLVGQPVMDLFNAETQAPLKGALAACLQGRWSDHLLKCGAVLADGSTVALELVLIIGEYEGEPSVQLIVPARKRDDRQLAAELADAVHRDSTTGLWQRQQLLRLCGERLQQAAGRRRALSGVRAARRISTLVERDLGVSTTRGVPGCCSPRMVRAMLGPNDIAGHFGARQPAAAARARQCPRRGGLEREPGGAHRASMCFTVGERSMRATCSAGVALLSTPMADLDEGDCDALGRGAARRGARRQPGHRRSSAPTRTRACRPTTRSGSSTSRRR